MTMYMFPPPEVHESQDLVIFSNIPDFGILHFLFFFSTD